MTDKIRNKNDRQEIKMTRNMLKSNQIRYNPPISPMPGYIPTVQTAIAMSDTYYVIIIVFIFKGNAVFGSIYNRHIGRYKNDPSFRPLLVHGMV